MQLYGYFRSSASYRVRIALNFKGLEYAQVPVHLVKGEQKNPDYLETNPQGLVPSLEDDGDFLTQSIAIIEYLEEKYDGPQLLPTDIVERARVRAMTQLIACEMQPLNNLGVLKYLKVEAGLDQAGVDAWYSHWIERGFKALEELVSRYGGKYCFGDEVSMVDVALIPQMYNARRAGYDLVRHPQLCAIEKRLLSLDAFERAQPENQPDHPDNA
jgi:maleylacetoacetate isomerase